MPIETPTAYDEIIDFLAAGITPKSLIAFQPSEAANHFQLRDSTTYPISPIGEVTARILGFNDRDRLIERQMLINRGLYPRPSARQRMGL
jgi:hypothetical protein